MTKDVSEKDRRQSEPFWYANVAVNKWYWVLAFCITIPVICGVIVGVTGSFEFADQSEYDYLIRGNPIVQDGLALIDAESKLFVGDVSDQPRQNEKFAWTTIVYFRNKNGNALTADSFNLQQELERNQITTYEGFEKFCYQSNYECTETLPICSLPLTVLLQPSSTKPSFFGQASSDGSVCAYNDEQSVSAETVSETVPTWFEADGKLSGDFSQFVGNDATASNQVTAFVKTTLRMGAPLEGYSSVEDREEEQDDEFNEWSKGFQDYVEGLGGDTFEIRVFSTSLYSATLGDLAFSDFVWVLGSIAFVLVYMCYHTTSIYLGVMGMLQIILAFPLTFCIYRLIFRVSFFTNLHLLAIFLILGIGADDVFVFTDAFVQAGGVLGESVELKRRMAWSYRRAAKAMLITSFTTAMAFFVTAANSLIPISAFGIWAACLIIFQYVLCILMFPANLVVWQRQFRYRYWRKCLKKVDPFTGEVEGTEAALEHQATHMEMESRDETADMHEATKFCFFIPISQGPDKYAEAEGGDEDFKGSRPLEKFYHSNWSPLLMRLRYGTIVLGAIIFGLAVWGATLLEPLATEEAWIPDWHPAQQPLVWERDYFGLPLEVNIVHGLDGIDQSNVGQWTPDDIGDAIADPNFDLGPGANREFLVQQCQEIGANTELVLSGEDSVQCWISAFQEYLDDQGTPRDTDFSQQEIYDQVQAFLTAPDPENPNAFPNSQYARDVGFNQNEGEQRIVFSTFRFISTAKDALGYEQMYAIYEQWEAVMIDQNEKAPEGVNNGYPTSISWLFMVTQKDLVDQAVRGLGITLAVAFAAITLSTFNIVIGFYCIFIVGAIVTCMIAFMYLYGWAWGISESVAVVLIVGFSVDYVVHIANAYVESANTKRYRRTRDVSSVSNRSSSIAELLVY
mmetsp:Transcript_8260/g.36931  ORF Transcript_8260/g.36931 Transcript_8260/m.36931 type:complete len:908 (-) Transcript_8260:526-3249(-)